MGPLESVITHGALCSLLHIIFNGFHVSDIECLLRVRMLRGARHATQAK